MKRNESWENRIARAFLVAGIGCISACTPLDSPSGEPGASSNTRDVLASATIGTAGGVIEVSNRDDPLFGARINVPSGALASDTLLEIRVPSSVSAFPSASGKPRVLVAIEPSGIEFRVPITVTVPYEDATDESLLSVFVAAPATGHWLPIEDYEVDTDGNKVSFRVQHLSTFGIDRRPPLAPGWYKIEHNDSSLPSPYDQTPELVRTIVLDAILRGAWMGAASCTGIIPCLNDCPPDAKTLTVEWTDIAQITLLPNGSCTASFPAAGQALPDKPVIQLNRWFLTGGVDFALACPPNPEGVYPVPTFWIGPDPVPGGFIFDFANGSASVYLDLTATVAHEWGHMLGVPHLRIDDPNVVMGNVIGGQQTRVLSGTDKNLFLSVHPELLFAGELPRRGTVADCHPLIGTTLIDQCGFGPFSNSTVIDVIIDGTVVSHDEQLSDDGSELTVSVPSPPRLTEGVHYVQVNAVAYSGEQRKAIWTWSFETRDCEADPVLFTELGTYRRGFYLLPGGDCAYSVRLGTDRCELMDSEELGGDYSCKRRCSGQLLNNHLVGVHVPTITLQQSDTELILVGADSSDISYLLSHPEATYGTLQFVGSIRQAGEAGIQGDAVDFALTATWEYRFGFPETVAQETVSLKFNGSVFDLIGFGIRGNVEYERTVEDTFRGRTCITFYDFMSGPCDMLIDDPLPCLR